MRWKYIKWAILIIVAVLVLIPCYNYFGSIDWAKKHSKRIAELPVFKETDDTGEFRLQIGELEFLIRVAGMQNEGPAVILLHGFPESSIMWTDLLNYDIESFLFGRGRWRLQIAPTQCKKVHKLVKVKVLSSDRRLLLLLLLLQ